MPRNDKNPTKPNSVPKQKTKQGELIIRYTIKHARIVSLIPNDFEQRDSAVRQLSEGTPYNTKPLLERMGIPTKRWNKILEGGEPTMGEVIMYANHFSITDLSTLYRVLPFKKQIKKAI